MNVFSAMEIAASGLNAERTRMNVIASNLANAHHPDSRGNALLPAGSGLSCRASGRASQRVA